MAIATPQIIAFLSRLELFGGIDNERMAFIAERIVQLPMDELQLVYEQGQESGSLYIIYDGRVQATRYPRGAEVEQMIGFLDPGDLFGQEALEVRQLRQMTIQTVTEVDLLQIDRQALVEMADQVPELVQRLALQLESFQLMLRTRLDWVNPEEYVHYITRKHKIFLWVRLAPLLAISALVAGILLAFYSMAPLAIFILLLVGGLMIAIGVGVWLYVDWSNDYYIVTNQRVVYQERIVLLYDSRQESPMEQVQSTEIDRSYMGQLLGYGDVRIRTYTGLILFQAVRLPREVEAIIQEHIKRNQSSLRQAEIRSIEETIARRIGMIQVKPPPPKEEGGRPVQASQLQRLLADLFHLRYEFGDTIQYRTHWWILVTRIWFTSLLLLFNLAAMIYLMFEAARGLLGPSFPLVGAFMGLCLIGLVVFLFWVYNYVDWHNDIYLITGEQVVDINRKPLGQEERRAAPIRNILSVEYKRVGVIGLLLNFGTVFIRIGDAQFTFDNVFNPSEVQRELFHRMAVRTVRERQQQAESERQRMAEWIAAYHRLTKN